MHTEVEVVGMAVTVELAAQPQGAAAATALAITALAATAVTTAALEDLE